MADNDIILKLAEASIIDEFEQKREYSPQDDMTGKEAALCAQLLLTASMLSMRGASAPLWPFVTKHNLERHFPPKVEIALAP